MVFDACCIGISQIALHPNVFKAINPIYAYDLLTKYPSGFWLLGAVFLCTTGAEALYSDLGHCGRKNIHCYDWIFVKTALLLNYFGQSAWLLTNDSNLLNGKNPFYEIMPEWFLIEYYYCHLSYYYSFTSFNKW
ncbi:MAG: KUP/HAK/KT family potassium transporter [Saprospiraceae bacterium]